MKDSFMSLARAGKIVDLEEEINKYIDLWHNSTNIREELSVFLGFSNWEYSLFLQDSSSLYKIVNREY